MTVTKFQFNREFAPKQVDGTLVRTRKHDTVAGSYVYEFDRPEGPLTCAIFGGALGEASYRFTSILPWVRKRQLKSIWALYGTEEQWKLEFKNRDGQMYFSTDESLYAAIGKGAKYLNIGSMLYHAEKFRIVS